MPIRIQSGLHTENLMSVQCNKCCKNSITQHIDFTRNGNKHTNTYSQSRVHAACKQNTTIHHVMKLQYYRIRMFHDSTTCRGFNTSETLTMTYTIHPMHSAFIKIHTCTCTSTSAKLCNKITKVEIFI